MSQGRWLVALQLGLYHQPVVYAGYSGFRVGSLAAVATVEQSPSRLGNWGLSLGGAY